MKKLRKKKPNFNFLIAPDFKEKELEKMAKLAERGNILAKIDIIMHNQRILDYKLIQLLK